MDYSLEQLDLSVRAYNLLKRNGYNHIGKISGSSDEKLLYIKGMGKKQLAETRQAVKNFYEGCKGND